MQSEGYPERFNLGLLTTSGSLGLLFPPSLPIIIFGYVASTSIDKLFVAGILPGILLVLLLASYSIFTGSKKKVPRYPFSVKAALKAAKDAQWEIPLPLVIMGGIYGGIFTVPEAAAITAAYVILVEVYIYRDIPQSKLFDIIQESMILVGGILVIMGSAMGLTNYLVDAEVPMRILDLIRNYITSKYAFLLLLNVFLLIVGCMMDIFSAMMVVVPLIVPIAVAYDVNLVHLGIIFLANLEMGYATPPVGMNLFISSFRFGKPVFSLYKAALPFLGILLIALLIITYVPALSLFLVGALGIR
jgi:tripartite ATP-independent transporter DctM subunit